MVSMSDTVDVNQTSCCMRKNPTYKEQVYDGIHVNIALSAVYFTAFASGFKVLCLGSFISILINSAYMYSIWDKAFLVVEEPESLDNSMESDDSQEPYIDETLSLKQREQGAILPKSMDEEDEIILNSRFQQVVEETRRRNGERLTKIPRTPTGTSINDMDDEDEYADMPPLVSLNYPEINTINPRYPASIHDYNNIFPVNSVTYSIYDDLRLPSPYISTFRDIITPSRSTALHGMEEVD